MKTSDTVSALFAALAKAQSQFKPAIRDAANPFFKSKYADMSSIWEAAKEGLFSNGLFIVQGGGKDGDLYVVVTRLGHSSGEWIETVTPLPVVKPEPQGIGALISYGRRYALAAILGIVVEDDDGQSASHAPQQHHPTNQEQQSGAAFDPDNQDHLRYLNKQLAGRVPTTDFERIYASMRGRKASELDHILKVMGYK